MSIKKVVIRLKGGLGNQFFIYAFGYYLKSNYSVHVVYDTTTGFIRDTYRRKPRIQKLTKIYTANLFDIFIFFLTKKMPSVARVLFQSAFHEEISIPKLMIVAQQKNLHCLYLEGYFQSTDYLGDLQNQISKDLNKGLKNLYPSIADIDLFASHNSVSIHVRRIQYDEVLSLDYYQRAIQLMNEKVQNPIYYVFSDDIDWCKINFKFSNKFIYVETSNDEIYDFYRLSSCSHHIIANSSFSWWGAYLSISNGIKICPMNDGSINLFNLPNWYKLKNI